MMYLFLLEFCHCAVSPSLLLPSLLTLIYLCGLEQVHKLHQQSPLLHHNTVLYMKQDAAIYRVRLYSQYFLTRPPPKSIQQSTKSYVLTIHVGCQADGDVPGHPAITLTGMHEHSCFVHLSCSTICFFCKVLCSCALLCHFQAHPYCIWNVLESHHMTAMEFVS